MITIFCNENCAKQDMEICCYSCPLFRLEGKEKCNGCQRARDAETDGTMVECSSITDIIEDEIEGEI